MKVSASSIEKPDELEKNEDGYMLNGNYVGDKGPFIGTRHVQIFLLAFCLLVGIATKASFAVQIVAMTSVNSSSPNPDIPTYSWTNTNVILSSFFWTYVVSNIFAAPLEKRYGPKWFLLGAIFLNCIAFLLIPICAEAFGSYGVLICRVVQGMGQGFLIPTQQVILGLWAPAEERSRCGIAVNTGYTVGIMVSSILPGYLSASWWGWPSSFYAIGGIGLVWCGLYLVFGYNSPATHPTISAEEKRYIQMSLNQHLNVDIPIPFKDIATSIYVGGILVAQIGIAWSNNMAMTEYNSFLDKVMNFDIKSNGLYSAIPPGIALITGAIFGPMSDYVIKYKYLSVVNSRRLFHLAGGLGISASVVGLSFLHESQKALSIVLMTMVYVSQSAMVCGNGISMIDLSPRFAGIIFGISNAIGQCFALFAPLLVQLVVKDQTDITQWRIVFVTTAAIIVSTSIFFVIFSSGERQSWDGPVERRKIDGDRRKKVSVISMSGDIVVMGH